MSEIFHILVIEKDHEYLISVLEKLQSKGIQVVLTNVTTFEKAHALLLNTPHFDLIISDLYLPDKEELDLIQALLKHTPHIPLIVTTSHALEEKTIRLAFRLGIQDYLPKKEFDPDHLLRVIYSAIERSQLRKSLEELSFTDEMTGVYNRRGFFTLLEQQLSLSQRTDRGFFLFIIDLDYLKVINDTYGHRVGDQALKELARGLQHAFRHHDIIGRIGGDEFAVIVVNVQEDNKEHLIQNIHRKVEQLNQKKTKPYKLSFSLGVTYYNGHDLCSLTELMERADIDLYQQKRTSHLRTPPGE